MTQLFQRKPIAELVPEGEHALKRVLGAGDLVMLAIGAVIGAGIFSSIGTAAAGVAAVTLVPFYNIFPTVGVLFDIKGFIIVVLGGLGSIGGAILGGIIVGLIESIAPQFMTATWTEAIVYGLFLVVLFVKPSGLFGVKYDW